MNFIKKNFIKFYNKILYNNINIIRYFKIFEKARQVRVRQIYRTGVIMLLIFNIISLIGFSFWFLKITLISPLNMILNNYITLTILVSINIYYLKKLFFFKK